MDGFARRDGSQPVNQRLDMQRSQSVRRGPKNLEGGKNPSPESSNMQRGQQYYTGLIPTASPEREQLGRNSRRNQQLNTDDNSSCQPQKNSHRETPPQGSPRPELPPQVIVHRFP